MSRAQSAEQLVRHVLSFAQNSEPPKSGWLNTAVAIACDVHDCDTDAVTKRLAKLDEQQLRDLVMVVSMLVPTDRPVSQLLGWLREPERRNQHTRAITRTRRWTEAEMRAAHSRYNSALKQARATGVELCVDELTREGEREYGRTRSARRTDAA